MRVALINPHWNFERSIYFGCREPHLPLELGYSKALLERSGHEVALIDGHMEELGEDEIARRVDAFRPDLTVLTTAPTYLFWRCAPPELRVPAGLCKRVRRSSAKLIVVGPHGSTTPRATLRKLGADFVVLGECEEVLVDIANGAHNLSSVAFQAGEETVVRGPNRAADMKALPALHWPDAIIARHRHHHHR
ncbi:MAG: cobalamin-dependent protein, partial [Acidobacteriaceae bacterium]|nr:cobalamin-dependent protein [Acidobacteriaceae bacterium]